jgi:hypothetical protein
MAARKRRRKRSHGHVFKAKLDNVIKSLQDVKKHVGNKPPKRAKRPRRARGPAKTIREFLPPIGAMEAEPETIEYSPVTLRSPN